MDVELGDLDLRDEIAEASKRDLIFGKIRIIHLKMGLHAHAIYKVLRKERL